MAAAKGADTIFQCSTICLGRSLVVDLRRGVQRDVCHGAAASRDVTPPSQLGHGSESGHDHRSEQIKVGIVMKAFAEQQRLTAAVGDVRKANGAVDEEDAVPRDAGINLVAGPEAPNACRRCRHSCSSHRNPRTK